MNLLVNPEYWKAPLNFNPAHLLLVHIIVYYNNFFVGPQWVQGTQLIIILLYVMEVCSTLYKLQRNVYAVASV